jgi:competence protein ComEC
VDPPPLVDAGVVLAGAAMAGALAPVSPAAVLLVVVVALGAARLRRLAVRRAVIFLALAIALVCGLRTIATVREHTAAVAVATTRLPHPSRCAFHGVVASMPVRRGVLHAEVKTSALSCEDGEVTFTAPIVVRIHALPDDTARGDELAIVAQLALARTHGNPDLGDGFGVARRAIVLSGTAIEVTRHAAGAGSIATIDRLRASLRRGLDRVLPAELSPIGRALVLGEEDLDEADDEAFRQSGLTHLLAVSGSHVALVVGGFVALVRRALLRVSSLARRIDVTRIASLVGVPWALAYEQLAGDSGSARRATAMAVVLLLARAGGRRGDLARTLAISILAAVLVDPLAPLDVSFTLSLAATLGLIGFGPKIERWLQEHAARTPRSIRLAVTCTLSATIACAPLVATMSGSLPLLGVVANVVAVPLGELAALPLANAAALLGAFPPTRGLASLVGEATGGALLLLRGVARIASAQTWASIHVSPPTPLQLAVLVAALVAAWISGARGRRVVPFALVSVAVLLLLERVEMSRGAPHGVLRVTVLDVGQGDALLVDLPNGSLLLVDGGGEVGSPYDPGRAVVARVLAARRRRRVDVAILSHPHPDHFLGLAGALRDVDVTALWDTGQGEVEGAGPQYAALLGGLRRRHVAVVRPADLCGPSRMIGGATLDVLHPCPSFDPDRGPNDNSFVLRLGYGERHVLLVGDAERETEELLVAHAADRLSADFLKVGHHGSRTSSSPSFLRAVSPSVAAISCGVRNRFGHPHLAALEALAASGAQVLRTDRDGSIRWSTDGHVIDLATARSGW